MKIAIDVDNTITDTFSKMVEYCEIYNKNVLKKDIKRNGVGSSQKMYNWTDKEQVNFAITYFPLYALELELKEHSKEIINKLNENHEIYILTARTENLDPKITGITKKYLDNKKIKYKYLITDCLDKTKYCKENKIDILIEDEPQNILGVSKYLPVIMLSNELNTEFNCENCYRCSNWLEIERIINQLKNSNNE